MESYNEPGDIDLYLYEIFLKILVVKFYYILIILTYEIVWIKLVKTPENSRYLLLSTTLKLHTRNYAPYTL